MAGYQKDRSIRAQEFDLKERDFREKEVELSERLTQKKSLNYRLTNDYFEYKHTWEKNKASLEDQLALARVENEALK